VENDRKLVCWEKEYAKGEKRKTKEALLNGFHAEVVEDKMHVKTHQDRTLSSIRKRGDLEEK